MLKLPLSRCSLAAVQYLTFSWTHKQARLLCSSARLRRLVVSQAEVDERRRNNESVPAILQYVTDSRIVYNSYLHRRTAKVKNWAKSKMKYSIFKEEEKKVKNAAVPLIIEKTCSASNESLAGTLQVEDPERRTETKVFYPFSTTEDITFSQDANITQRDSTASETEYSVKNEIAARMQAFQLGLLRESESPGTEEDVVEDSRLYEEDVGVLDEEMEGTADPSVPVSEVPCGGCGAHLHCQEPSLMGFVPKEWFVGLNKGELRCIVCQRCHYMQHHQLALNVRVSPDMYPKLLQPIKDQLTLVLLLVDLLDFPCSVWPGILDLIGTRRPVVVVGNKVDLLPADGQDHLKRVREALVAAIKKTELRQANIVHTALVSATTGYGIESLITRIQRSWATKGNMYLLGCTNSGKSSLFNALLESDLCKTKASSLVRHATVSPWPGTTLNMLRFPLLRPSSKRLYERVQRLRAQQRAEAKLLPQSDKIKYTKSTTVGTLRGHVGQTYRSVEASEEVSDPFSVSAGKVPKIQLEQYGLNPKDPDMLLSKWLYDTPGTVQPDQLINLLTHEELMKVVPRSLIHPRTYCLQPGMSLFIGGLARLDLLYSPNSVRLTVYRSVELPVTVVRTVDAAAFYRDYLGSPLLVVPSGGEGRLQQWPVLKPANMHTTGADWTLCCCDVVLSSAGWISVSGGRSDTIEMRAWTPEGRGIYLRQPSLLPLAVNLRGNRIKGSPACRPHKLYVP